MKEKIKRILLISLPLFLLFAVNSIEARQGCCSWHGGVCGCQCCDGTPLSSTCLPYYPECGYIPETYSPPSFNYPSYPSIPSCPLNSYYDSFSDTCKCYSGYIVSGGNCISADQYCWDLLGYSARYNISTDSCECNYGYVISGGKCVSQDRNCKDVFGFNAEYNSLSGKCECSYGYVVDDNGTSCISGNIHCHNKYGYNSSYDSLSKKCKCNYGYVFDSSNQCVSQDEYCVSLFGSNAKYDILSDKCICKDGYMFLHNKCISPEFFSISQSEAKIGDEITIRGANFGDSKYGGLILYIGYTKVNTFDISRWQDDEIVFTVTDYLSSGYIALKNDYINVRGSYLEILPTEQKTVISPQPINQQQTEPQQKTQPISQESSVKPKSEELPISQKQQDVVINQKQEQKPAQKKSRWAFLANISNTFKNFFSKIFHR